MTVAFLCVQAMHEGSGQRSYDTYDSCGASAPWQAGGCRVFGHAEKRWPEGWYLAGKTWLDRYGTF